MSMDMKASVSHLDISCVVLISRGLSGFFTFISVSSASLERQVQGVGQWSKKEVIKVLGLA